MGEAWAFEQWIKKRSNQWKATRKQELSEEAEDHAREIFKLLDMDHSGTVDASELGALFSAVGESMKLDEVQKRMSTLDADGNGTLDEEEFLIAVSHNEFDVFLQGSDRKQIISFPLMLLAFRRKQLIESLTSGSALSPHRRLAMIRETLRITEKEYVNFRRHVRESLLTEVFNNATSAGKARNKSRHKTTIQYSQHFRGHFNHSKSTNVRRPLIEARTKHCNAVTRLVGETRVEIENLKAERYELSLPSISTSEQLGSDPNDFQHKMKELVFEHKLFRVMDEHLKEHQQNEFNDNIATNERHHLTMPERRTFRVNINHSPSAAQEVIRKVAVRSSLNGDGMTTALKMHKTTSPTRHAAPPRSRQQAIHALYENASRLRDDGELAGRLLIPHPPLNGQRSRKVSSRFRHLRTISPTITAIELGGQGRDGLRDLLSI